MTASVSTGSRVRVVRGRNLIADVEPVDAAS
jgi:hypothetical protein